MGRFKGTPGPWRVYEGSNDNGYSWPIVGIGDVNAEGVTDCGFGVWRDGREAAANARAIAAVPQLIEALEAAPAMPRILTVADVERFMVEYAEWLPTRAATLDAATKGE